MHYNFKLVTKRPYQERPLETFFVEKPAMVAQVKRLVASHFVGTITPFVWNQVTQAWMVEGDSLALLTSDPIEEQSQLFSQLQDFCKTVVKQQTMLTADQKIVLNLLLDSIEQLCHLNDPLVLEGDTVDVQCE